MSASGPPCLRPRPVSGWGDGEKVSETSEMEVVKMFSCHVYAVQVSEP